MTRPTRSPASRPPRPRSGRPAAVLGAVVVAVLAIGAMAELRAAVRTVPQDPDGLGVVSGEVDIAGIRRRLGDAPHGVWLDGDVLHFACISPEGPVSLTGGIQRPLERVEETDVWLLRLRRDDWSKAFISWAFVTGDMPRHLRFELWRGEEAPATPHAAEQPHAVHTIEIDSRFLGEARSVTIVLPPGEHHQLPAIVMADGQGAVVWGKLIAPMIDAGVIRPVAIVGIHSGGYRGDRTQPYDPGEDFRAREYLESSDPDRFAAHLRWVIEEVLPAVSERFGISTRREDLAVAGFSNGGAFAATAGLRAPKTFGAVLGYSIGVPPDDENPPADPPLFLLAAGELERGFLRGTRTLAGRLESWGVRHELRTYLAGHDPALWSQATADFLPAVFPPQAAEERRPDPR